MKFTELDFDPDVIDSIDAMGFKECTPIQAASIPVILDHKDLIAVAQTGTGKTAAFLLPVMSHLMAKTDRKIDTIIIVPTRELAIQIDQQIEGFSYYTDVTSIAVYGGSDKDSWNRQQKALEQGADIVIATPGRFMQHLGFNYTDLSSVKHFILDEADRMLDMGFNEDISKIEAMLPKDRQTLLFSATMPDKIRDLGKVILTNPEEIAIAVSKPAERIMQIAYLVYDTQKVAQTITLLRDKDYMKSIIIFVSRKLDVNNLAQTLRREGFRSEGIHSDLDQPKREEVLRDFKSRKTQIIVATDIISRGIDIDNIDLVINYNVPSDPEDYVHRIGRTARAQASGIAITYISDKDQFDFSRIEELIEKEILKLPPHLDLGAGPQYDPNKRPARKGGGRGGKFGGKRPFKKR